MHKWDGIISWIFYTKSFTKIFFYIIRSVDLVKCLKSIDLSTTFYNLLSLCSIYYNLIWKYRDLGLDSLQNVTIKWDNMEYAVDKYLIRFKILFQTKLIFYCLKLRSELLCKTWTRVNIQKQIFNNICNNLDKNVFNNIDFIFFSVWFIERFMLYLFKVSNK